MNKPVFIVGVGRSGTTLIRLMLHSHPVLAIPYESHFITRYDDKVDEYGELSEGSNLEKLLRDILSEPLLLQWDHDFDTERVRGRIRSATLEGVINAVYEDYASGRGKTRWGDKSDYLSKMYVINRLFPDAQFIHCVRDGRDVASSVMKMEWGPKDLISAAEWWASSVRLGRSMGRMLSPDRYLEVRYEDLVRSPEELLRDICIFLGEDYFDSMLAYHKQADIAIPSDRMGQHRNVTSPPDPSRVFAWKRQMSKTESCLFEKYAFHELSEFGYETRNNAGGAFWIEAKRAGIFAKRLVRAYRR